MSLRLSSNQSAHLVSLWGGLGIPGSEVPTDGDNGGSPLVNDGISPTAEYRIETVTAPSAGTLTVFPDTSYEFSGAPDGEYSWVYRVWEDSVDRGTATEYLIVGSPVATINATTAPPVFSGGAHVSPVAAIAVTTALPTFSGAAGSGASAAIAATTVLPSFVVSAHVSPVAAILADTALPTFVGSASVYETTVFSISTTTGLPTFNGGATGYVLAGVTLTPADIEAIADAVWNHIFVKKLLTIKAFLGLK